jgi:site-specific DNA-methyltransferase (adenine-specific)
MDINKIYNLDCFEGFKMLDDKSVDHVFTSPPYNRLRGDKYSHYNDNIKDYFGFLCNTIDECLRVSKGFVFFNIMKNYYNKEEVFKLIGHYHKEIVDIHIWQKSNPLPASGKSVTNAYEFFIILGDSSLKSNTTYTKNIITTAVNSKMPKDHKAVMNQDVSDWFIDKFTTEGDLILDPFMGYGTTAMTCIKMNRDYIGFELQKEYVELAENRIKNDN